jgi:SAM-dependent methyltransferase
VAVDFDEYYRRRYPTEFSDRAYRWHPQNPIALAYRHQLERALLWAFSIISQPVEELRILDVGCGSGAHLRLLLEYGASIDHVHGVDLLAPRVERALAINPSMDVKCIDAASGLPFPDAAFDLVTQFVALSSILDRQARRAVGTEMVRVLRVGGWLLSYDTVLANPGQVPDGLGQDEMMALFPGVVWIGCRRLHHRALAKLARWPLLAEAVERIPAVPKTNLIMIGQRVE